MSYDKQERENPTCLECGKALYGRPEKKFCCDGCRTRYHYRKTEGVNRYKSRTITSLATNHRILDRLVENGIKSISLAEIEMMGFRSNIITGIIDSHKPGERAERLCFNIVYKQNSNRLTDIRRLENIPGK